MNDKRSYWLALGLVSLMALTGTVRALAGAEPATGAPKKSETAKLPPPAEIIAKHIKLVGGKAAFLKHSSTRLKGKFELPAQGLNGPLDVFAAKPNKMLVKITLSGFGEILSGYDGKVGWSVDPAQGPMVFEGKRLEQLRDQADYYSVLHDEKDFKSMETIEVTTFEEKECYKIKLVRQSGQEATEYYDMKTGLQLGQVGSQESPLGTLSVTSVVSDYKKFGDVMIATRIAQKVMGIEQVMTVESVEFDKVTDSVFELPEQIKALVKK